MRTFNPYPGGFGGRVLRDGEDVGDFAITTTLLQDGTLGLHNEDVHLSAAGQGHGFGRSWVRALRAGAADAGAQRITMRATDEDGGVFWTKVGRFELDTPAVRTGAAHAQLDLERAQYLRDAFRYRLHPRDPKPGEQLAASDYALLAPRLLGDDDVLRSDTYRSVLEIADEPFADRVLVGSSWNLFERVTPARAWWASGADAPSGAPQLMPQRMAALSQHIDEALPATFRASGIDEALRGAFGGRAATQLSAQRLELGQLPRPVTQLVAHTEHGAVDVTMRTDAAARAVVEERFAGTPFVGHVREQLDDAWRMLGVHRAIDAARGTQRAL